MLVKEMMRGTSANVIWLFVEQLEQTKVTGVEPVNKLQDGVNSLVGGQLGKGGAGEGVGDLMSKEGINRTERGGKDEEGKFI